MKLRFFWRKASDNKEKRCISCEENALTFYSWHWMDKSELSKRANITKKMSFSDYKLFLSGKMHNYMLTKWPIFKVNSSFCNVLLRIFLRPQATEYRKRCAWCACEQISRMRSLAHTKCFDAHFRLLHRFAIQLDFHATLSYDCLPKEPFQNFHRFSSYMNKSTGKKNPISPGNVHTLKVTDRYLMTDHFNLIHRAISVLILSSFEIYWDLKSTCIILKTIEFTVAFCH